MCNLKTGAMGALLVMVSLVVIGCAPSPTKPASGGSEAKSAEGKDHSHAEGPHEGAIAEWGDGKYHVEFTVDHDKKEAALYILGGDMKTPVPLSISAVTLAIKEPAMTIECKATPAESDAPGTASKFVGQHEGLGTVREFAGTISGVIDGTPFSGDFHEHAHAGHDH